MSKQVGDSLFLMTDFRTYVRSWAGAKGRGEFRRIAKSLGMHTTLVSQVLNGRKCLTEEQAVKLSNYMSLSTLESDYFLKLVQLERAGTEDLKRTYERHLKHLRIQATEIKNRVPESKELNDQDRAIFYSSWQYSVIRLMTSIEQTQTKKEISSRLDLPMSRVQEVLDFLVSRGLCREDRGRYIRTEKNTHVEARSPLAIRHHQNWRGKAFDLIEKMSFDDLAFTAPVSISKKDISKVKEVLLEAISKISKIIEESPSEECMYFGIDWLKVF